MSPMEEFEEDLAEIKGYQPYARRIFWTGVNPFAMSYENLKLRALTIRDYRIKYTHAFISKHGFKFHACNGLSSI